MRGAILGMAAGAATCLCVAQTPSTGRDLHGGTLPPHAIARLGVARFVHGGQVWCLACSPDGRLLASAGQTRDAGGSYQGTIRLWDAATGGQVGSLAGHRTITKILAFSRDGGLLLSAGADATVRLWDAAAGKQVREIRLKAQPVHAAISPDGKLVAAVSGEGVRLWDAGTGEALRRLGSGSYAAFSPDGARLVVVGGRGRGFTVYEVPAGKEVLRGGGAGDDTDEWPTYLCAAFAPDGRCIAASGPRSPSFVLYDARTGRQVRAIGRHGAHWFVFSPDGACLAAGHYDNAVRIHVVDGGKERHRLPPLFSQSRALAFSHDGKALATSSTDGFVRLWDAGSGKERLAETGHRSGVLCLAYSPDGEALVTGGGDGRVLLWEPRTGKLVKTLAEHGGPVGFVDFSPDGTQVASSSAAYTVPGEELWVTEVESGKRALDARGRPTGGSFPSMSAFSLDGSRLISVGVRGAISVTAVSGGEQLLRGGAGAAPNVRAAGLSPGAALAAIAEHDTIRIVRTETATELLGFRSGYVSGRDALAFCPHGDFLTYTASPDVRLVEVASGRTVLTLTAGKPPRPVPGQWRASAVACSPDGRLAAGAANDRTIRVWDAVAGAELLVLSGHGGWINSLRFSADGTMLASAGGDGTVLVWSLRAIDPPRQAPAAKPDDAKLSSLWTDLADADAGKAYAATWALVSAGDGAAAFLDERVRPTPPADAEKVRALIDEMSSPRFAVRAKAYEQLKEIGAAAEVHIREALKAAETEEVRSRLESLLAVLSGPGAQPPEALRAVRAVGALERIGGKRAEAIIRRLAGGPASAAATRAARAALARLAARGSAGGR